MIFQNQTNLEIIQKATDYLDGIGTFSKAEMRTLLKRFKEVNAEVYGTPEVDIECPSCGHQFKEMFDMQDYV